MNNKTNHNELKRELGLFGATMMGLGSIIGTGIFVSIGVAAGVTGPSIVFAIILATLIATCNALSSAQFAVSGGTYEYGYRYLHPVLGFMAGWMFLCAKTASAATAALGFAGYLLHLLGVKTMSITPIAIGVTVVLTLLVLSGLKRSNLTNIIIVLLTLISLIFFVLLGIPTLIHHGYYHLTPILPENNHHAIGNFFYATALMLVAFTGYGRIATLAEEVKNPKEFIPRAIIITLIMSALLYVSVSIIAISAVGASQLTQITQNRATPLEVAAQALEVPGLSILVAVGACTAMLGVLLNLILGLSRVTLAMGRKGDLPRIFSTVSQKKVPLIAIIGVGFIIVLITLIGNIKTTWSFSAFTVLVYYSITNLAALRVPKAYRFYSPLFPLMGLIACLLLAFCVPPIIWGVGLALILLGFIWQRSINFYYKMHDEN